MRTPIITVFIICILIIGLALAFYDYRKHGIRYQTDDINITKSESEALKNARQAGEELTYKQDYEGAIAEYERALKISPRDAYLRNNLGASYYYLGLKSMEPPMEEDDFGLGKEIDGRHISKEEIFQKLEEVLKQTKSGTITLVVKDQSISKQIESYIRPLNHYVHIEGENTDDGSKEYWITIIMGKTKEAFLNAEKQYLQAIELKSVRDVDGRKYSNYSAASRNLGTLYFRMGRKKEAIAHWSRALQIEPTDAELRELIDKYD